MAIAAVWTMSTARSPITWHSNIWHVLRSTIICRSRGSAHRQSRAGRRVELNDGGHNIVRLTWALTSLSPTGVLRVCEAASWTSAILKPEGRASNRTIVDGRTLGFCKLLSILGW